VYYFWKINDFKFNLCIIFEKLMILNLIWYVFILKGMSYVLYLLFIYNLLELLLLWSIYIIDGDELNWLKIKCYLIKVKLNLNMWKIFIFVVMN